MSVEQRDPCPRGNRQTGTDRSIALALAGLMLLLLALVPLHAQDQTAGAPKRLRVAVLWFEDKTGDPELAHGRWAAWGLLRKQLHHVGFVRLVSSGAIDSACRKVGTRTGEAVDPNRARRIGEHVEAQRVVWGSCSKEGNRWRLDVWIMNVATGEVSTELSANSNDWLDLCNKLLPQILAQLGVVPTEEEKASMARRWIGSSEALDWYYKACLYQEQDRPLAEQEACLRNALAADPNCVNILVNLATMLANRGKDDEAKDLVGKALRLKPDDAEAHSVLAIIYLHREADTQKAEDEIREACRLDPDEATHIAALARILMAGGESTTAIPLLQKAISLDPTDPGPHALLAHAYAAERMEDKAIAELKEAERLEPQGMALVNLELLGGSLYHMLDKRVEAIEHYERFVTLYKKTGGEASTLTKWEGKIRELRASLTPTFVDAQVPTRYTREDVDKILRERLTEQEHHLAAYPFAANETMGKWAEELTHGARNDLDKAKAIYEKLSERHASGEDRPALQTAQGVFEVWANSGIGLACTDHTILFVALARAVDVDAYFVNVEKDAEGRIVRHACAGVFADGRALLVDTLWRWFGVPAKQYAILDDIQATALLCLNRPGDPEDIAYLRAGLRLWPDCGQGQLGLAVALARAHQWLEAYQILAGIPEPQVENADAASYWRLRGEAALRENDLAQAEKHLTKALSLSEEESGAHFPLGVVRLRRGQLVEARAAFRASLRNTPNLKDADEARRYIAVIDEVTHLIQRAGNADSEEFRLDLLRQLRSQPGLNERLQKDLDRLIREIERWNNDRALDYFGREVSRTRDYDFGIGPDSPLYALTYLYRGRMVTWYALESGSVWKILPQKMSFLEVARGFFEKAAAAFPENKMARMYLGEPVPAPKQYPAVAGAPDWAVYQREGLERLADIIEWWIEHRMREDGQYGGGWGDDCEMWRWWTPILIGFESPQINAAQAKFSRAIMSQPHMKLGYTTRMSDVEHTAEDSADAITAMMHIDAGNPEWSRQALRLAELMETLWTGRNERGFLQFKSTYFTAEKVDPTPARACDTVYHARVVQPTLLYWQRTGDSKLTKLFSTWMDTWVDAAARAERGKPAGIIPTAIHWPEGHIGGLDPNWWDPRNHGEYTLYLFPSAMSMMTHTLLLTHHMTGDAKYLEPIRSMAKIRLDYLASPPRKEPTPGTATWCAARLEGMTDVVAKYKLLTGRDDLDALLAREKSPYVRYRLDEDRQPLAKALQENAEALRLNFPGYTSEVRYTDRVLRFPTLFSGDGILRRAVPAIRVPNPALLYSSATGDPGTPEYFPMNAVRWLTPPRDIAALVHCDTGKLRAELFHFGATDRPMGAEFYLLKPGAYVLTVAVMESDAAKQMQRQEFAVAGPRTRVAFTLPAQKSCLLRVERQ